MEPVISCHHVLKGHPAIPRGWPLNIGSTVFLYLLCFPSRNWGRSRCVMVWCKSVNISLLSGLVRCCFCFDSLSIWMQKLRPQTFSHVHLILNISSLSFEEEFKFIGKGKKKRKEKKRKRNAKQVGRSQSSNLKASDSILCVRYAERTNRRRFWMKIHWMHI